MVAGCKQKFGSWPGNGAWQISPVQSCRNRLGERPQEHGAASCIAASASPGVPRRHGYPSRLLGLHPCSHLPLPLCLLALSCGRLERFRSPGGCCCLPPALAAACATTYRHHPGARRYGIAGDAGFPRMTSPRDSSTTGSSTALALWPPPGPPLPR